MNKNVLLVEGIHPIAKDYFEKQGFLVKHFHSSTTPDLLQLSPFSILGIRSRTQLNADFFNKTKELLSVGAFCIGINQIDISSATHKGVAVFNSPYSNTRSVAELVIANIVNLSRKITHLNHLAHSGQWQKSAHSSYEVRGKTLGIIGYGHIGSQVSILAEALGMRVYYYDIHKKLSLGNAKALDSLSELLPLCDFITLHVPQTSQTKNMITKTELQKMKKGSYLINTSRGHTVCMESLVQALKTQQLNGAAIDVFPEEPANNTDTFSNELQKLQNVILTPHIGGSTQEAQVGIAQDVSRCLFRYFVYGDSAGSINFPQLSPPNLKKDAIRIANVHQNTSGVLSSINRLISNLNINVQTQYLATTSEIGYLMIDLEKMDDKKAPQLCNQIQNLETSIQTRLLPNFT